jgi:hypothetical protein
MVLASSFLGRHRRDGLGITDLWYEVKARTPVKLFGMSLIDKGSRRFGELGLRYAQLSDDRWLKKLSEGTRARGRTGWADRSCLLACGANLGQAILSFSLPAQNRLRNSDLSRSRHR